MNNGPRADPRYESPLAEQRWTTTRIWRGSAYMPDRNYRVATSTGSRWECKVFRDSVERPKEGTIALSEERAREWVGQIE